MQRAKKHIITIAGKPGSGKSTTSKGLAASLGYLHFSSGDFFRAIGKERGFDVLATNLLAEQEKAIDEAVDQKLRDLGEKENQMVIDSRMAWHWMPYSLRVYLDLDLTIAAERILGHMDEARRAAEFIPDSPELYAKTLQDRLDSESKRYMNLYNVNPYDPSNYDLVIDTATHNIPEVQKIILETYSKWIEQ
ncbi:MAG: (d)CMP kinase [Candidatus Paceibacteria bacterium]